MEMVHMVTHLFYSGTPTPHTSVLSLDKEDLQKLKELIDSKKHLVFYSGVRLGPAGVEGVWVDSKDHVKTSGAK